MSPEQRAQIQERLRSLGLYEGESDGEFGRLSRVAVRRFQGQRGYPEGDFLTATQHQALLQGVAAPASAQPSTGLTCTVADPSDSTLNIRATPAGDLRATIPNRALVNIVRNGSDDRGRPWSLIARNGERQALGWVYQPYLYCGSSQPAAEPSAQAQAVPQPGPPPAVLRAPEPQTDTPELRKAQLSAQAGAAPQPGTPPAVLRASQLQTDTPELRKARLFLDDARDFITSQQALPSISAIASEAANLQLAITNFDEASALHSMKKLGDLLKPLPGFSEFLQERVAERDREQQRHLAEVTNHASRNIYFIDGYMRTHLGDERTPALLKFRGRLSQSITKKLASDIDDANTELGAYLQKEDLSNSYEQIVSDFRAEAPASAPKNTKPFVERLSAKTRFIADGAADEIVLLFNATSTAPNIYRNIRGDFVFQHANAQLCFAQPGVEPTLGRYVERLLKQQGANTVVRADRPCDASRVAGSFDILAFQRGELLKRPEDYIFSIVKLIDDNSFQSYRTVTDYAQNFQQREALSLQIEADLENLGREGFGVISVGMLPTVCVVTPTPADWSDGIKSLLNRDRDLISPNLNSDWRFVEGSGELGFLGLQRAQCGYLAADAATLQGVMQALRRDQKSYVLSPVWFTNDDVRQAAFDVRDVREQQTRTAQLEKQRQAQEALLEQDRQRKRETEKTAREQELRDENRVRTRALTNSVQEYVKTFAEDRKKALAEDRIGEAERRFPSYTSWLKRRFADQWETYNVTSEVADFGTVQWEGRSVDAIVVKSILQQKNRILGKYEEVCFLFAFVDDAEFTMERDRLSVGCDNRDAIGNWKIGKRFRSQWNVE